MLGEAMRRNTLALLRPTLGAPFALGHRLRGPVIATAYMDISIQIVIESAVRQSSRPARDTTLPRLCGSAESRHLHQKLHFNCYQTRSLLRVVDPLAPEPVKFSGRGRLFLGE